MFQVEHQRQKNAALLAWYRQLLAIMEGRALAVTARVAEEWAKLQGEAHARKRVLPEVDALPAATARRYQLTLATNDISDFGHRRGFRSKYTRQVKRTQLHPITLKVTNIADYGAIAQNARGERRKTVETNVGGATKKNIKRVPHCTCP